MNYNHFWLLRLLIEWTLIITGLVGVYYHSGVFVGLLASVALGIIVIVTTAIMREKEKNMIRVHQLPNGKVFIGSENQFIEFLDKVAEGEIDIDGTDERREDEV